MINHNGETNHNKHGTEMIVINTSKNTVTVKFCDEFGYVTDVKYSSFKKGTVRNPYDKSIANIGYFGVGKHKLVLNEKNNIDNLAYDCWSKMIRRCYTEMNLPSYYKRVSVCKEWHNFQTFADWYENNIYECSDQLHLDKDIKNPNSKEYSPINCILIPREINLKVRHSLNTEKIQGVQVQKNGKYRAAYGRTKLGTFVSLKDAYKKYNEYRKQLIVSIANKYKKEMPNDVYQSIVNFDFPIEFEINYEKNLNKINSSSLTSEFLGKFSNDSGKCWKYAVYDDGALAPDINNNTFYKGNRFPMVLTKED